MMVGYNRTPTPTSPNRRVGFLAALAKRRRGSQQPRAISLSLFRPLCPAIRAPIHATLLHRSPPRPPLAPSRPIPTPPIALSSCRCRSFRPLLSRSPLTPRPTRYASHLVVPRHPLSPCGRPPAFPPAGPRKRGIASNSNYRTRGYHASNLTLGCPMCDRARLADSIFRSKREARKASEYGNVDRFFENAVSATRRREKERRVSLPSFFFEPPYPPKIVVAGAVKPDGNENRVNPTGETFHRLLFSERNNDHRRRVGCSAYYPVLSMHIRVA